MTSSSFPFPNRSSLTADANLSGVKLGDYVLLRRLGRGGMANVYLAEQVGLRRQVAIKVLKNDLARDPQYVSRFHFEAQAAARLVHGNIVQIFQVGEVNGYHFIAQEFVKGLNLKQFLQRNGAADVGTALAVMRQVASALGCAAEQGVTHRDIKPENILIGSRGEAKVADFGLARVVDDAHRNHHTQVGVAMGTPLYMSPEQVEGKKVDPRSDLYSFGVTCYEMLAGRPPFEGDNALAVAVMHLKEEPIPLEIVRPDVPAELCGLIRQLMAKKPESRPATANALLRELRQFSFDEPVESWSEVLNRADVIDIGKSVGSLAETRQLGLVMKQGDAVGLKRTWSRVAFAMFWGVFAIAGVVGGGGVAWVWSPIDLLEKSMPIRSLVPRQSSVEEQLRFALRTPSEENFMAVEMHWPRTSSRLNLYYAMLADVHLGEVYLRNNELQLALERYRGLENVDEQERRFLVVSLVGQGIVLARLQRFGEAREVLQRLDRLLGQLEGADGPQQPTLLSSEILAMLEAVRLDLSLESSVYH